MSENLESEQELLRRAIIRLNTKLMALVLGLLSGMLVFLATIWLVIEGGHETPEGVHVVGPHLQLLSHFFIGYSVSFWGSIVGFLYGFALGTIIGSALGRLYNGLVELREQKSL